jgi:prepilin-type N-terminal cleavage/methylation domain-containing protein
MRHRGFTLVELLVVITIMVVLLAILTPALDRAIYQAELAACSAQMKGAAIAVTQYAMSFRRSYPYRQSVHNPDGSLSQGTRANGLRVSPTSTWGGTPFDDRPALRGFVALDQLLDPLCGAGVLDLSEEATHPETNVYSNYFLWYGWQYRGHAGMLRMGDRFGYNDAALNKSYRFNLLLSDDDMAGVGNFVESTHPDADGKLHLTIEQNQKPVDFAVGGNEATDGKWTLSRWVVRGTHLRGLVDLNYAYADGSVTRLPGVEPDGLDERTVLVPYESNGRGFRTDRIQLPYR